MDILSHFFFAYILFGHLSPALLLFVAANLPDFFAFPFKVYYILAEGKKISLRKCMHWRPNKAYLKIYRFTHSFLFAFLIFLILSLVKKRAFLISGCVFSHLFIDAFSHTGEWATRPLFPFSDFHVDFFKNRVGKQELYKLWIVFLIILTVGSFLVLITGGNGLLSFIKRFIYKYSEWRMGVVQEPVLITLCLVSPQNTKFELRFTTPANKTIFENQTFV